CLDPPHFPQPIRTAAELRGIRYERVAQAELSARYGSEYIPNPWFSYLHEGRKRYCSCDGLLFDLLRGRITIVEIKIKHVDTAYFQVRNLYEPVVEAVFNAGTPEQTGVVSLGGTGGSSEGALAVALPLPASSPHWTICTCEVVKWHDGTIPFPVPVRLCSEVHESRLGEWAVHIFNPKGFS